MEKVEKEIMMCADMDLPKPRRTLYTVIIKRCLDIILSGLALIVLSPTLLVVSILELVYHGRPILYSQERPGLHGKIFRLFKFRSMTNERDAAGELLPEEKRLTRFGHFIRKTSLDELPGLINIFIGDMSIIGPRPLLVKYLPLYSPRHAMRHEVRPGLALARIKKTGSKTWTWRDQFENDVWYVENVSFSTDVRMLFAVAKAVFKGSEYRASDTRVPFNGHNLDETKSKQEVEALGKADSAADEREEA